jgi:hypothetical protein
MVCSPAVALGQDSDQNFQGNSEPAPSVMVAGSSDGHVAAPALPTLGVGAGFGLNWIRGGSSHAL